MIPKELDENFQYYEKFISKEDVTILYQTLKKEINWEEREITLFGKTYMQPRLIKWFGEKEYTYSNQIMQKEELPQIIKNLQKKIEEKIGTTFNSVLINYYRDGNDSMGKHSDDEKELGSRPTIASISLGTNRDFFIQEKLGEKKRYKIELSSGSLLIMKNDAQKIYSHELPKRKKVIEGRINLTFRYVN